MFTHYFTDLFFEIFEFLAPYHETEFMNHEIFQTLQIMELELECSDRLRVVSASL